MKQGPYRTPAPAPQPAQPEKPSRLFRAQRALRRHRVEITSVAIAWTTMIWSFLFVDTWVAVVLFYAVERLVRFAWVVRRKYVLTTRALHRQRRQHMKLILTCPTWQKSGITCFALQLGQECCGCKMKVS